MDREEYNAAVFSTLPNRRRARVMRGMVGTRFLQSLKATRFVRLKKS